MSNTGNDPRELQAAQGGAGGSSGRLPLLGHQEVHGVSLQSPIASEHAVTPTQVDVSGVGSFAATQDTVDQAPANHARIWKRNERIVYLTNFFHMTMVVMCAGSVFDIFLYNLSEEKQILITDAVTIGHNSGHGIDARSVNTFSEFELTFEINPSSNVSSPAQGCNAEYTCATSVLHITNGLGNGDCCAVGNRIPAFFFSNGPNSAGMSSTALFATMDSPGQPEQPDRRLYIRNQSCSSREELPVDTWSSVKVKQSGNGMAKGKFESSSPGEVGALVLFINGKMTCQIAATRNSVVKPIENAHLFLGPIGPPYTEPDQHVSANAQIRNLKYGKPASNFFVGIAMSTQGVCAVLIMYPVGWLGDRWNRYSLLRFNLIVGATAAILLGFSVYFLNVPLLFTGLLVFSAYQQCLSSTIYAMLADNVPAGDRQRAGMNYKTLTALAMALGPALQLLVILWGPAEDNWTSSTFNLLLLPGWSVLALVTISVLNSTPVGKEISLVPNVDEVPSEGPSPSGERLQLDQAWLDELIFGRMKRRFVVAASSQAFFIGTLLANGMTVRYFSLYFTQVLRFGPAQLCILNAVCRLWIAGFVQLGRPLARIFGRANLVLILHFGSAFFTLGIYGGGFFRPSIWVACGSYLMRFAFLHSRDPFLYSMTMDVVPSSQRSRWASLNSLRTLSFSGSALIGGYLADLKGYEFSFEVTVYALVAATVLFLPAWLTFPKSEGGVKQPSLERRTTLGGPWTNGNASP